MDLKSMANQVTLRRFSDKNFNELTYTEAELCGRLILLTDIRIEPSSGVDSIKTIDFRHDDEGGEIWYCSAEDRVFVNYSGSAIISAEDYDALYNSDINEPDSKYKSLFIYLYDDPERLDIIVYDELKAKALIKPFIKKD